MADKKHNGKKRKRTAAARMIPVLLLCVFVLSGLVIYVTTGFQGQKPPDMSESAVGAEPLAGSTPMEEKILLVAPEFTLPDLIPEEQKPHPPTMEEIFMKYIKNMTLEEKVGQMFLVHCPETDAEGTVQRYWPGGIIFFARDFKDKVPAEVQSEMACCQEVSQVPLLTAVDEEGGDVNRISWYPQYRSTPFLNPQKLYAEGGWERIEADTAEKCELLASLGVNVNLAPVCDISQDPSAYIYRRTFGQDATATSEYVRRVVAVMNQYRTGCALKHFPGYGGNSDTHKGFSVDNRSYSEFAASDLRPFEAGIEAGAGCVMVSHNIVTCMDGNLPASLSPEVHRVLREDLGFQGVIMTDDLAMKAISDAYGTEEAAVLAVNAGNDMLCCTDYEVQIPAVIAAVESGKITEERIEESVLRVLQWKHTLGLVETESETV